MFIRKLTSRNSCSCNDKSSKKNQNTRKTRPSQASSSSAGAMDSLDQARMAPGSKPSRDHENSTRLLEQWVSGGSAFENRREAANRILQSKKTKSGVTDLRNLALQSLPEQIETLTETKGLWLSDNDLQELPTSVARLRNLQVLEVDNNRLGHGSKSKGVPNDIGNLNNLQELSLSQNRLSSLPPSIGNLSNLKDLDVSKNRLEHLPAQISNLGQLEKFSANHNFLSQVPGEMGVMSQLRNVNLSNNQMWSLPDSWGRTRNQPISLSETMRRLDLSDNNLHQLPNSFAKPSKRIELDVSNNPALETLPINYGGFTYDDNRLSQNNNLIKNQDKSVKVNVTNTKVRQGLVDEGRLQAGRGVYAFGPLKNALNRPPPPPMVDNYDADSIYSVEDYVNEHRIEGGIVNLEQIGSNRAMPMQNPTPNPYMVANRVNNWTDVQANTYGANRGNPPPPPPPKIPTHNWSDAVPSAFQNKEYFSSLAGPSYAAHQAPPQALLQPQFIENLLRQVEQLPPDQQLYMHECLKKMPPEEVVANLIELQNLPIAEPSHPQVRQTMSGKIPSLARNIGNLSINQNLNTAGSRAGPSNAWTPAPWAPQGARQGARQEAPQGAQPKPSTSLEDPSNAWTPAPWTRQATGPKPSIIQRMIPEGIKTVPNIINNKINQASEFFGYFE